jgi:hypothetical protein
VCKPERKRPHGIHRRRWEDNNKMDIPEVVCGVIDLIDLGQDRDIWRALIFQKRSLLYGVSKSGI